MALLALLFLSLVLFSFSPKNITLTQAHCLPDQCQALIQLKQGFKTTRLNSWNASIDYDNWWYGIICDETGMVTELDLSYFDIWGEINPALFNLSSLRYLDLSFNNFFVPLPQNGFERLTNLTYLNLSSSGFSGEVLPSITNLRRLNYLDLGSNRLTGKISKEVGQLKSLRVLNLSHNALTGRIPSELASLHQLESLDISYNQLSGPIPHELASLTSLNSLDLLYNNLVGEIPEEIGKLKSLCVLNLAHNALAGRIPSELASLHQLESLDLSSNQLSGPIPHELASLTSLYSLNLSYNNLVGEVPESFSNDSYLGNPGLCGRPLSMQCPPSNFGFIVSIGVGLYFGFATVIWALVYWENGRKRFILIIDKFYFRHFH